MTNYFIIILYQEMAARCDTDHIIFQCTIKSKKKKRWLLTHLLGASISGLSLHLCFFLNPCHGWPVSCFFHGSHIQDDLLAISLYWPLVNIVFHLIFMLMITINRLPYMAWKLSFPGSFAFCHSSFHMFKYFVICLIFCLWDMLHSSANFTFQMLKLYYLFSFYCT